jgi:hypothetical protein
MNIDYTLLESQRKTLDLVIENFYGNYEELEALEGIRHLLDAIMDQHLEEQAS